MNKYVSGVILYDETFHQKNDEGKLFTQVLREQGIVPGIKVSEGSAVFNGKGNRKLFGVE